MYIFVHMYSYIRATTHSSIPGPKPRLISWTNLLAGFPGILVGPNHPITPPPNLPRSFIIYFPQHFPLIPLTVSSTSFFTFISPSMFSFLAFFFPFLSLSLLSFFLLSLLFSFFPPYCPFFLGSISPFSHSYFLFFPPYCPFLLCSVSPFSHSYFLSSLHFFHIFYLIFLLFLFFLLLLALTCLLFTTIFTSLGFPFSQSLTFFSFVASFFSFSCLLPYNLVFFIFPHCETRWVCLREWAGYADVWLAARPNLISKKHECVFIKKHCQTTWPNTFQGRTPWACKRQGHTS